MNEQKDQVIRVSFTWIVLAVGLILLLGILGGVLVVAIWPPVATPLNLERGVIPQVREITISPNTAWSETITNVNRSIIYLRLEEGNAFVGNGVVVTNDGLIATTANVQGNAIIGVDFEGKEITVDTVGSDTMTGISYLRMSEGILPPLDLRSENLSIGTETIALARSTPSFGLRAQRKIIEEYLLPPETAAEGVQRVLQAGNLEGTSWTGAPLIDESDKVAGLILDQANGIALPSEILRTSLARISRGERESNPFQTLGIQGKYVFVASPINGQQFGYSVSSIIPSSPADKSGIQAGDIIVSTGDTIFSWNEPIFELVKDIPTNFKIIRDEELITLPISN